jgi:hypothetical protein
MNNDNRYTTKEAKEITAAIPNDLVSILSSEINKMKLEISILRGTLDLIAMPKRSDGTYNRSREACEILAREVLDKKYD